MIACPTCGTEWDETTFRFPAGVTSAWIDCVECHTPFRYRRGEEVKPMGFEAKE